MSATGKGKQQTRTEGAVKDMTHGIIGKAADGTMAGGHYDPGYAPEKR